jgi:ElaB/YqjD/DUF883 family membrane-anchored ribosome-binding protein
MAVFSEAFSRLRQDFDQGHESRQKLIQDIRANVEQMARQTGDQIQEQATQRRAEFATMIGQLRSTIRRQADETRTQLAELSADLHQGGATFASRQPAVQHNSRKRWTK